MVWVAEEVSAGFSNADQGPVAFHGHTFPCGLHGCGACTFISAWSRHRGEPAWAPLNPEGGPAWRELAGVSYLTLLWQEGPTQLEVSTAVAAAIPGAAVSWSGQHAVVAAPALRLHLFCALADRPHLAGLAYARAVLGEIAAGRDGSRIFWAWELGSQSLYDLTLTGLLDPAAPVARPLELALIAAAEAHAGRPLRPDSFHDRFFDDLSGLIAAARLACPDDPLMPAAVVGGADCPDCCGDGAMWRLLETERGYLHRGGPAETTLSPQEAATPAIAGWCPAPVALVPDRNDLPLKWSLCRLDRDGYFGEPGRWHWIDRTLCWSKMDAAYLGGPLQCALSSCSAQARWAGPYEGGSPLNLCDSCFLEMTGKIDTVFYRWVEADRCWHRGVDGGPVGRQLQLPGWPAVAV